MPRDTSFYYSFLALPALERDAIISVWDFCRAVDDAVDEVGGASTACPEPGRGDPLARWRRELASCFGGGAPETEQGRRLEPHVSRFQLPRQPFEDLIDGVEMDLHRRRYETFELLHQYCLRVASAVGLICLPIFGARHTRSREYATYLGVALQLTNIIRDVSSDLARGRLYLPLEDLHRFGCTEGEVEDRRVTGPVRKLLQFECERARGFYRRAKASLPREDARRLVAARIMGAIYFDLLRRIERAGYDVFSGVIRVPPRRRAWIAAKVWAGTMMRIC
ncbi:MAG: presqualene diphosphate synthase HpnD [Acidobacteria bacterium]|nr:presqualene diphosphate synthase HpnD [Acidobacteriota bacterium]